MVTPSEHEISNSITHTNKKKNPLTTEFERIIRGVMQATTRVIRGVRGLFEYQYYCTGTVHVNVRSAADSRWVYIIFQH